MITLDDYFGPWKDVATQDHVENAIKLLAASNALHAALVGLGVAFPYNPATHSLISGQTYGGYRPQTCTIGAASSAHKTGMALDLYDPAGEIDQALLDHRELLDRFNLYIEHPDATPGWSHWSTRAPRSGRRVFFP